MTHTPSTPANPAQGVSALFDEGLEILANLIDNIKRHGNYSPESTCMFIDQAGAAFREARRALTAAIGAGGQAAAWQNRMRTRQNENAPWCEWSDWRDGKANVAFMVGTHAEYQERPLYANPAPSGRAVASRKKDNYCSFCDVKFQGNTCPSCRAHISYPALSNPPAQPGWRDMPASIGKDIIVIWDDEKIEIIKADDNDFEWKPYPGKSDYCSRPIGWLPLDFLPAAPLPGGA